MALIDLECPAKFLKSLSTDVSSHRCRLRNNNINYYYYHYYYCNIYFYSAISITVQREHTIEKKVLIQLPYEEKGSLNLLKMSV